MKKPWFLKVGWFYLPISWQGMIATLAVLAFCAHVFLVIDYRSHSVSDTFYGIFPYWISALGILWWIGSNASKQEAK